MSIFISYKRENLQQVQRIVQGLRGAGLQVWWDQDIRPDDPWEQTIESELEKAKVVIVAWSQAAVGSENVKAEARRARNQGKLIQTFVQPCEPPLFFGERQGVDLSSWNGDSNDHRFKTVLEAARAILAGKKPPQGVGYAPKKRGPWALLTALFSFLGIVLALISNLGGARDAVCSVNAINSYCAEYGLITATVDPAALQETLIRSLEGRWSRGDRPDCSISTEFIVTRDERDNYSIRSVAPPDFESTMQVATIDTERGAIVARTTRPGESGVREQWEFYPNGDLMQVVAPNGTPTPLARCD